LQNRILTADIGNTATKFGIFENSKLRSRFSLPTERIFADLAQHVGNADFSAIIACSVVPEVETSFKEICLNLLGLEPLMVTHEIDFGISVKYYPLESLGIDRLVTAFSAVEKYGFPLIICDFGTATTIDAVNSKKEFLGGVIFPGVEMLSEALFEKTSKLPKVEVKTIEKVIGNSTASCIQSGIFYGYLGFAEKILSKMMEEMKEEAKVVATGGAAKLFADYLNIPVDENLTLEGLRILFERTIVKA
ncbi:MAG: type III pantothenate kinase, partial [Pyrinomonadaceae bacterium]